MQKNFIWSSGILFTVTGSAKIISSFGNSLILQIPTPILGFSYQKTFIFVGLLELIVAFVCFFTARAIFQITLIAWLATCFFIYRLGLLIGHYQKPCPCLGNLTRTLHISEKAADITMGVIVGYLLIGSYAFLYSLWRKNKKTSVVVSEI